mmetsp:Transcript_13869/g.32195  ORF Transcript_13869/g.32195 Transcript_13869/m.32195 type:complete len:141 (-) Transcript_13869:3050-3472(-)
MVLNYTTERPRRAPRRQRAGFRITQRKRCLPQGQHDTNKESQSQCADDLEGTIHHNRVSDEVQRCVSLAAWAIAATTATDSDRQGKLQDRTKHLVQWTLSSTEEPRTIRCSRTKHVGVTDTTYAQRMWRVTPEPPIVGRT